MIYKISTTLVLFIRTSLSNQSVLIMRTFYTLFFLLITLIGFTQTTVTLSCNKDNTIYSESGSLSNATGVNLFAGVTSANNKRRSLVHFNLENIPAGATITSVTLTLNCNNVAPQSGSAGVNIHKVLNDWGEATSGNNSQGMGSPATTNDATWTHRFFNSTAIWNTPGGDFTASASGGAGIPQTGVVNISTSGLKDDVQAWLTNAATNFGWAIVGNTEGSAGNARRFASRNNTDAIARPTLSITYTGGLPVSLTSFTGSIQANKALLTWKTASENNNSHFNVEQSTDGRNFRVVGKVNGAGNAVVEKTYSFLSSGLVEGKNFYRLAQVDFDGTTKYSSIVSLSFAPELRLRIEPNPVIGNLVLKATSSIIGKQYYISSPAGKVVQKGSITGETINIASLANGMYFLNVEGAGKKFTSTMFAKQ